MKPKLLTTLLWPYFLAIANVSAHPGFPTFFQKNFATPTEGTTDFNGLYSGTFVDLTGSANRADGNGLLASNVSGYDFRLFASNATADFGIGIEPFTGETALVYGYSTSGNGYTTALEITANEEKLFDLQSIDIIIDKDGASPPQSVQLIGYYKGNPVSGATLTMPVTMASAGGTLVTFNTVANSNFRGVNKIRIEAGNMFAIGVDNINAINFRTESAQPLTLLSFTGRSANNLALLNWKTENERNTSSFEIERSTDGANFTIIGRVDTKNKPGTHYYTYVDKYISSRFSSIIYYRLRQNDLDNVFHYSPVLRLTTAPMELLRLYPNPAKEISQLFIALSKKDRIQVTISDCNGKVLHQENHSLPEGEHILRLDLQSFPSGVYHVEVKSGSMSQNIKLLKP